MILEANNQNGPLWLQSKSRRPKILRIWKSTPTWTLNFQFCPKTSFCSSNSQKYLVDKSNSSKNRHKLSRQCQLLGRTASSSQLLQWFKASNKCSLMSTETWNNSNICHKNLPQKNGWSTIEIEAIKLDSINRIVRIKHKLLRKKLLLQNKKAKHTETDVHAITRN